MDEREQDYQDYLLMHDMEEVGNYTVFNNVTLSFNWDSDTEQLHVIVNGSRFGVNWKEATKDKLINGAGFQCKIEGGSLCVLTADVNPTRDKELRARGRMEKTGT